MAAWLVWCTSSRMARQPRASAAASAASSSMRRHAAPAHLRRDRNGIEAGDRRARPEQHDRRAGEPRSVLRHDHLRVGDCRKRRRLRRDNRSVANTRCSSSSSTSMSPRSALRTRTAEAGAWARLEGIVIYAAEHTRTAMRSHASRFSFNGTGFDHCGKCIEPARCPTRPTDERNAESPPRERP